MASSESIPETVLVVVERDGPQKRVPVTESPFLIGRADDVGNHLLLADKRVSRRSAAVVHADGEFRIEDRGQRNGILVNGKTIKSSALEDADVITFGSPDSVQVIFHSAKKEESLPELLTRLDQAATLNPESRNLRQMSLLLEATALLQSHLPVRDVLGAMIDRALTITTAERGLLLEAKADGELQPLIARRQGGRTVPVSHVSPSWTAIQNAREKKRGVVEADIDNAPSVLKDAKSVVGQELRSVIAIPLMSRTLLQVDNSTETGGAGDLLGVLYMDSQIPAAFSSLEREILDALAVEASSVLDKARLVQREQDRRRLDQELNIAREIQQALLPKQFQQYRYFQVTGINRPSLAVGGDYFDLMEIGPGRTALVIADVSGKGLGAALVTAMLQGTFSAMTLGQDPSRVFSHVNRFICSHSEVGRFATLFFGILDETGKIEFINAGHVPPLLAHNGKVESVFRAESFPLGMFPQAEFKPSSHVLQPGDTLILSTDGIMEAANSAGEDFGEDRLREIIEKNPRAPVEDLQAKILAAVEQFTGNAPQADDLTLLIVRYQGTG